ncbi:MAG TPA: tetratricopeptide repeat protein [Terracidiphilus sp.]|nr:tetratricopeptide repeat protein [Terracidiphilus sp.]
MHRSDRCHALRAAAACGLLAAAALPAQNATEAAVTQPPAPTAVVQPQTPPEELGDSLMAHKRYQAAIEAYKQTPKPSAAVWNKMGIAYQMMYDLDDAMQCYKTSLKLEPKNVNVLNNLGTVYDSQKDYKRAVKMYRKALKADPHSALVLKNLGTDLLAQHKYKKGWQVYQSALVADPQIFDRNIGPRVENPASRQDRGAMNYYMAKGCMRAGRNDRAIEYLRAALNEGYISPKKIETDVEFAGLHNLPAYKQLMAEQEKQ